MVQSKNNFLTSSILQPSYMVCPIPPFPKGISQASSESGESSYAITANAGCTLQLLIRMHWLKGNSSLSFYFPFHLPARFQNIILNITSPLLEQEIQEYIKWLLLSHNTHPRAAQNPVSLESEDRQPFLWRNFNNAAHEEHRLETSIS